MELGKYYQNKVTKTVVLVVGETKQTYCDGHPLYDIVLPYCEANTANKDVYGKFQLPYSIATNGNWSEVVIDSDGLVYNMED